MANVVTLSSEPEEWLELAWTEFAESEDTVPKSLAFRAIRMVQQAALSTAPASPPSSVGEEVT